MYNLLPVDDLGKGLGESRRNGSPVDREVYCVTSHEKFEFIPFKVSPHARYLEVPLLALVIRVRVRFD